MLYIVGIGFPSLISSLARVAIESAELVVGYTPYIEEIAPILRSNQKTFANGMRGEVERVTYAVDEAARGAQVCIVCSGDPSLYGMAALAYQLAAGRGVEISVIPSVTAAMAASAKLGAPITDDLVILSLSDLLTPKELIDRRIEAVNIGDFVCAIYNPRSKSRTEALPSALKKFREARGNLLVGAVTNAFREGESVTIATIDTFDVSIVDMFTLVLVGSSRTQLIDGKMVTPRGYRVS
ncbi:MAG: precorrin-3B C(17)-methyltransferase [Deferribacteraceae bacterium]|jgi:precorrin-3B C17-methyltransferase|nr:precorrin-3B C(17)-methyltransferase [Deferribacteraceae bacterium]